MLASRITEIVRIGQAESEGLRLELPHKVARMMRRVMMDRRSLGPRLGGSQPYTDSDRGEGRDPQWQLRPGPVRAHDGGTITTRGLFRQDCGQVCRLEFASSDPAIP